MAPRRAANSKKPKGAQTVQNGYEYLEELLATDDFKKFSFAHGIHHHQYGETFRSIFIPPQPRPNGGSSLGRREFVSANGDPLDVWVYGTTESNRKGSQVSALGNTILNRFGTVSCDS